MPMCSPSPWTARAGGAGQSAFRPGRGRARAPADADRPAPQPAVARDGGRAAFYRTLYADHPYAHDPDGDDASLAKITVDDLQRFHRRYYYVAENAIVAIVGAVDRKTAESIAEQVTGGLAAGQHAPPLPPVPTVSGGELHEAFPVVADAHLCRAERHVAT